eukprot:SAG22_NODE_8020_length_690_cov_0.996616_3_plen_30_part_01
MVLAASETLLEEDVFCPVSTVFSQELSARP